MDSNEMESVQVEKKKIGPMDLAEKIETVIEIIGMVLCLIGVIVPRLSVEWAGDGAELEEIIMNYRERWLSDMAKGIIAMFFIVLGRLQRIFWQVILGILILFMRLGSDFFFIRRLERADHVVTQNISMEILGIGLILVIVFVVRSLPTGTRRF